MGYSLDDQVTITVQGNTTMTGLSDGAHSLRVFACDTTGNTGSSIIYFTVETPNPRLFSDGFESGSFNRWNGTSRTSRETTSVVTSPVYAGSYSAGFRSNGGGGTERAYAYRSVTRARLRQKSTHVATFV